MMTGKYLGEWVQQEGWKNRSNKVNISDFPNTKYRWAEVQRRRINQAYH